MQVALVYMCSRLVVNISQSYLPLYLTETLKFEKVSYYTLSLSSLHAAKYWTAFSKSFLFAGQMVSVRASIAFAALILLGCGGGMMPRSTNKIARIPLHCRFLVGFFFEGAFCRFVFANLMQSFFSSVQYSYHYFDLSGFWKLTFLFSNKIKYSTVLLLINSDWSILRFMSIRVLAP